MFMAGSAWLQCLAALPSRLACVLCAAFAMAALLAWVGAGRLRPLVRNLLLLAACGGAGFAWAAYRADLRLHDHLAARHDNAVTRLNVRVAGLPTGDVRSRTFEAEVLPGQRAGIPRHVRVSWRAPPHARGAVPEIRPGEVWRMALLLRRPRGLSNPEAPDREAQFFARNIRAMATVRGRPVRLADAPWATAGTVIARFRFRLRAAMQARLAGAENAGVIVALALGDQSGITAAQWRLFNRVGVTHLVAISGLHIGLVAGLAGWLASALWRRLRFLGVALGERLPAQVVAALAGLAAAWGYSLLAGWGIPAQRAFFTLALLACAAIARRPVSASRVLALVAAVVTFIDPWAPLSRGFWLSFAAVAVLARVAYARPVYRPPAAPSWPRRRLHGLARAATLQLRLTAALAPVLAYLVQSVSLGSPLANAFAIPVVGTLVAPAALLGGALSLIPSAAPAATLVLQAAHGLFSAILPALAWIGASPWASRDVAAAPLPCLLLAMAGVVWALAPKGLPAAWVGWLLLLPAFFWHPARPGPGEWRMVALDVGQGGAIVVETARHVLVFDAGERSPNGSDAGERVVWPYLRARGYRRIDVLVVSHADLDHVGGVRSLLLALPVAISYASFDLPRYLKREAALDFDGRPLPAITALAAGQLPAADRRCARGLSWRQDGVLFEFLHPSRVGDAVRSKERNADSCVLRVQGRHHALLLTGDIGGAQEKMLAPSMAPADVVLAAHHGSGTSSVSAWIKALAPAHVVAQMGYRNRFGHPSPDVQARWLRAGAWFWRNDLDGAVVAESSAAGLRLFAQRDCARRYWHEPG
jgi:competence protein ComEC